jgi:hypothetical protein
MFEEWTMTDKKEKPDTSDNFEDSWCFKIVENKQNENASN